MTNHGRPPRRRPHTGTPSRGTAAALAAALLTAGALAQLAAPAAHAATPRAAAAPTPAAADPATAAATAVAQAKRTGKPVGIPALTTETETVAADPSGSLTLTESVHPTRIKRDGAWTAVDATLHVRGDGSLEPAAVPSGVLLSGGGTGPLATLTSYGKQLAVSWPGALPKPAVDGSTATYRNVLPGVDLRASVSPLGGFSEVMVVKNATAAANPRLATLTLNTSTRGLSISQDTAGNLKATDPTGAAFFTSPTPMMWDSTTTHASPAHSRPATSAGTASSASPPTTGLRVPASSADTPGHGAQFARIPVRVTGHSLRLVPDSGVLHGPKTHYPVYIDPAWNPDYASTPKQAYDEVQQGCSDKNALNSSEAPYSTPGVGLNDFSGCIGIERAFYQFKMDTRLWDSTAKVVNATFKATEVYSASCSVTSDVKAYQTSAIDLSTTWAHQPTKGTLQDTQSYGPACTSNPSQGYDVTTALTSAASGRKTAVTFGLYAADESNDLDFRRFSNNPTVTVQYDSVPSVSSANTSPTTPCSGGTIGNTSLTLNAYISDADQGAPVQAKFTLTGKDSTGKTVYPTSGSPSQPVEPSTTVTGHGSVSWYVGYLTSGTYTWTAQADDGKYLSAQTTCHFTVDATKPGTPSITSATFPQGATGPFRTAGEFDFSPPTNLPTGVKITKYAYNWGTPPPTVNPPLTAAADSTGKAAVTLTPAGYIHDVLYVYDIDSAGNESDAQSYWFDTAPPTAADPTGDFSGDGKPDLVVAGADGNLRLYTGDGAGRVNTPLNLTTDAGLAGAQLAVGGFRQWGEQDVLAVTPTGQASIYFGNGDAEPQPDIAPKSALLSPDTTFTWAQVTSLAADDSQYAAGNQPNLWTVTSDGSLWSIPSTAATGDFSTPIQLATGWQHKTLTYAGIVGGYPALWARDTSTGELDLYTGTANIPAGSPTSTKTVTAASGWTAAARPTLYSAGAANTGTGRPDLWATDSQAVSNLSYYPAGATTGTLGTPTRVQTLNPSDDFTGNGKAGTVAEWKDGTLHMYTSQTGGTLTGGRQAWDSSWGTMHLMVSGDFTGDGKADVIGVWGDGTMHLYPGTGTGGLDNTHVTQLTGGTTWSTVQQLVAGDFNNDGLTDLVAVWGDGTLHLYPNNGNADFPSSTKMWPDSTWSTVRLMAGADYTGDGNGDILGVWGDGTLHLYTGDGTGNLALGAQMIDGTTWSTVTHIIPGDFSSDGKADLAAVWGDGTLHLYTGNGKGSLTNGPSMWPDNSWGTMKLIS